MKIFIDTEFYEFQPLEGGNAVHLISLGAVREDGEEFYAENALFDWDAVPSDHWIQGNVRPFLWNERVKQGEPLWLASEGNRPRGGVLTPEQMAYQFHMFAVPPGSSEKPKFWGYFCDYDWVAICGLYGRMIDLPSSFPMHCLDLKQEMFRHNVPRANLPSQGQPAHHALTDARWVRDAYNVISDIEAYG